jgi:acyl carrier protein
MENKYKEIFKKSLSLNENQKVENLKYNEIDEWDSIGHMTLVSDLEEAFDVSFDTDDIVNFSSYSEGKKILSKLGIKF